MYKINKIEFLGRFIVNKISIQLMDFLVLGISLYYKDRICELDFFLFFLILLGGFKGRVVFNNFKIFEEL